MKTGRFRAAIVLLFIVLTAGVAHFARPTVHMSDTLGTPDLATLFPASFADWRIDTRAAMVLPDPATQALLNNIYNQTLSRTYINSLGQRIMLSVAYGGDQSDGTRAHLPEVCYPAQGFQISEQVSSVLTFANRPVAVQTLMSRLGTRAEPITYWLVVGDRVAVSRTDQKLVQFRLGLKGLIPDGMLVRVSSIDPDRAKGHRLQAEFLNEMADAIPEAQRDRVFGTK